MANKKKPTHEIKFGAIRTYIWTNVNRNGSRWYTITPGRLFKGNDRKWQLAQSYKLQHLPDLLKSIVSAQEWVEQRSVGKVAKSLIDKLVVQVNGRGTKPSGRSL